MEKNRKILTLTLILLILPIAYASQFARPDGDTELSLWTNETGGAVDIFKSINESSADDADYIESAINPLPEDEYIANLSNITDPLVSTDHVLRWRYSKSSNGGKTIDINLTLYQGNTIIVSRVFISVTGTVTQDTYTLSSNEADFITDYDDLRIRINASAGTSGPDRAGRVTWVEFEVPTGILSVVLDRPIPAATTNVIQNSTINFTANVTCLFATCGTVNGTPRYNISGTEPDTNLNGTIGDVPFYNLIGSVNQTCGIMNENDFCQLSWIINTTGLIGKNFNMDVNFTSDSIYVESNATSSAEISITPCSIDMTLQWSSIDFGILNPNSPNVAASGNDNQTYNVTVNPGSCITDLYIRGTDLTNSIFGSSIPVNNLNWSNTTNSPGVAVNLTSTYTMLQANVGEHTNITSYYWLNVIPVFAGDYNGTILILGVQNEQNP